MFHNYTTLTGDRTGRTGHRRWREQPLTRRCELPDPEPLHYTAHYLQVLQHIAEALQYNQSMEKILKKTTALNAVAIITDKQEY